MRCPACDHENIPGEDLCADCGMDLAGLDVQVWGVDPEDPLLAKPLAELPLNKPLTLGSTCSVAEAIELMRENHAGCVFVESKEQELVGVFTERDVTVRIASRGRDPEQTRLGEVMTSGPVVLQRDDPISWALHRMGIDGYRQVPVVDGERIRGVLSSRTVLQLLLDS
ncbi:MAG: CBS domain-containing protein [Acidobacteria bacterium]|nr:CBS domain-containing protein [Acidobacteriota bacterium]NIM60383.1 CBS domain-containing protein [Acidobacteriota bacterium]NIO60318.1 CBS domain-containing protein [Acidobacteriota bacterium]NIQ31373.1 CBS domain-containing protein [Acidobacteriota bacterium]NIQ86596.1 CBS domain-containing protein [Acidobacteriota bacterium]